MFAVVFPLAPLLAFVNNYFEPVVDLEKLRHCRRTKIKLRTNIGAWRLCFEFISVAAVITNCYLLAMVSTKVEVLFPKRLESILLLDTSIGHVLAMLFLEHLLFGFKMLLKAAIDDIPIDIKQQILELQQKRNEDLVQQQLNSSKYEALLQFAQSGNPPCLCWD